jgi:2-dehydro-3-deoxygluconokinase
MSEKVITFGEIMLRLSPPEYQRLIQADQFQVCYGGGEANVSVSLANYGIKSAYVTRLPDNQLGKAAANYLSRFGVDTSAIIWGGDRLGIYFAEKGFSQRPSLVVYDRAGSAAAGLKAGMVPWKELFKDCRWFHFTGITPALGDGPAEACMEAVKTAGEMGLTVSCDLNYRKKLWTSEKASAVMSALMVYVDIAVGNEEDAEKVFGLKAEGSHVEGGRLNDQGYHQVMQELKERFNLKIVSITLRESFSANENGWSALLYDGNQFYKSKVYRINIVDRIGAGDSFCGGLIYALLKNYSYQEAVDFASAASCLKHTIHGDANQVTAEEVKKLVEGDASGRVQR